MTNIWKACRLLLIIGLLILPGCSIGASVNGAGATAAADIITGSDPGTVYNVQNFGAWGDGVNDDSQAIQQAADKARDNKGSLLIPAGNYLLRERVRFYTSVDCQGTFIMENGNNNASIVVSRWGKFTKIPPEKLSGLSRGSTQIKGLEGTPGSTVVIKSAEKLINREQWGSDYNKEDTVEITGSGGMISPALDAAYKGLSGVTVTVYEDAPIIISNLKVQTVGDTAGNSHLVFCVRSNVTFKNPRIVNSSEKGTAGCGLHIYDSINVDVINPVIANFKPPGGDGYGMALGSTANINILEGNITDCSNHAITGRQDKNVLVKGGIYEGGISALDDHWGNQFSVQDAVLIGDSGITYAGTDIKIVNCEFRECINILAVRTDTPVLMGSVTMENITASLKKDHKTMFCYRAESLADTVPDKITAANITPSIPQDGYFHCLEINPANHDDYAGKTYFSNIRTEGKKGTVIR